MTHKDTNISLAGCPVVSVFSLRSFATFGRDSVPQAGVGTDRFCLIAYLRRMQKCCISPRIILGLVFKKPAWIGGKCLGQKSRGLRFFVNYHHHTQTPQTPKATSAKAEYLQTQPRPGCPSLGAFCPPRHHKPAEVLPVSKSSGILKVSCLGCRRCIT